MTAFNYNNRILRNIIGLLLMGLGTTTSFAHSLDSCRLPTTVNCLLPTAYSQLQADSSIQKKEFYKNFNKTFSLSAATTVVLSNKYGKVDVKTWDQNQAQVNVKITVRANSETEANHTFERINIDFTQSAEIVRAETNFGETKWWEHISNGGDYSIDYEVFMPASNKLNLANRYGASNIGCLNSEVTIEQKYGNFKMDCAAATNINLGYGNGQIGHCNALSGSVGYGKLNLTEAKQVQLKTKYSHFVIGKTTDMELHSSYDDYNIASVGKLNINARYGDFDIARVNEVAIESSYTDFKIKKIENAADLQTSYGGVKIGSIDKGFSHIFVNGGYTDYTISVDPGVDYQLDFNANYSGVSKPMSLKSNIDKEHGASKEVIGYVGSPNAKGVIRARLKYGQLILK